MPAVERMARRKTDRALSNPLLLSRPRDVGSYLPLWYEGLPWIHLDNIIYARLIYKDQYHK